MSRIDTITTYVLEASLDEPWDFGIEPYRTSVCVVIELKSSSGVSGFGEAIARKAPGVTARLVRDLLGPIVLGSEVRGSAAVWSSMFETLRRWGHNRGFLLEAIAGVDIALWDLRARELGVSVAQLLPNGARNRVETYASSVYFQESVDAAVRVALRLSENGHRAIKVKVGHREDQGGLDRDIATVLAIRDAIPGSVGVMLDANGSYRLAEAQIFMQSVKDANVTWLEEPFPADDLDAYHALSRSSPIPIAAGESEFSVFGFRDLIQRGALQFAQPDVARCGGLTGTLQVLDYCFAHRIPVCPHTGFSGGINNLVSMHVAATSLDAGPLEHMIIGNPLREIFTESLPEPNQGYLDVPQGVGFGHEIQPNRLEEFASEVDEVHL